MRQPGTLHDHAVTVSHDMAGEMTALNITIRHRRAAQMRASSWHDHHLRDPLLA